MLEVKQVLAEHFQVKDMGELHDLKVIQNQHSWKSMEWPAGFH